MLGRLGCSQVAKHLSRTGGEAAFQVGLSQPKPGGPRLGRTDGKAAGWLGGPGHEVVGQAGRATAAWNNILLCQAGLTVLGDGPCRLPVKLWAKPGRPANKMVA